ncbi:hypothetical protein [Moraxella ovis]|uniref:hypothetical protein n=1 Tax=Moraxella ovis TaxID=29433 RepID=UPI000D96A0A6|nr:Uncharacterised protein [Moraxella ovis]
MNNQMSPSKSMLVKNGLAPSQLNRQKTPIWGVGLADGQAPTSLTHPLTWRLYHHDAVLTLADYEALDGFKGLKKRPSQRPKRSRRDDKNRQRAWAWWCRF